MKKGSAHIVTLVQLLILCAMFASHPTFKSSWNNLKKKLRSFTRPIQALSVWKKAAHWYDFRANRAAMESYEESLPKYLSAKLLTESDQLNKPRLFAEGILNGPVKVESSATREIMREMKKF